MTNQKFNYIAGEWRPGESEIENRNPSDISDLTGLHAQASPEQLEDALAAARIARAEWAEFHTTVKTAYVAAGRPG